MAEAALVENPSGGPVPPAGLARLVGVQFRRAAAVVYDFDAGGLELAHDTRVIVESERGEAIGWTVGTPDCREPHLQGEPVRRILRVATASDLDKDSHLHEREREALRHCAVRARQLGLPMKVVAVEWGHSSDKATFYFSSDDRVDFRNLVRELAQRYRLRVEMRQVGPRDEAKIIGAMGPCGRETCCSSWMRAFTPVGIRMAKDQGLGLNPQKVTGVCGRLLCCLAYEQDTYREMRKGLPKFGKTVMTPQGPGRVVDVLTLRRRVRVSIEGKWTDFDATDVRPMGPQTADDDDRDDDVMDGDVVPNATNGSTRPNRPPQARTDGPRPERFERPRREGPPPSRHERPERPRPETPKRPEGPPQPPRQEQQPQRPPRPERPPRPQNPPVARAPADRPAQSPQAPAAEGAAPQEQRPRRPRRRGRGGGGGGQGGPNGGGAPPAGSGAPPTT